jgi:hypothetical protein
MLTVVVEVEVIQVSCVATPTVKANQPPGGIGCWAVVEDAPRAQYAVLVAPAFDATTTVPAGRVPVTPPVVTLIGVPTEAGAKPLIDAVTLALTGSGVAAVQGTAWPDTSRNMQTLPSAQPPPGDGQLTWAIAFAPPSHNSAAARARILFMVTFPVS